MSEFTTQERADLDLLRRAGMVAEDHDTSANVTVKPPAGEQSFTAQERADLELLRKAGVVPPT